MSDIAAIILSGTTLLIFLITHRSTSNLNRQRFRAVVNFLDFMRSVYPFRDCETTSEEEQQSLLDEYKSAKRLQLVIDGDLVQDLSIAEWENAACINGFNPNNPIQFAVETPEYKKSKEESGDGDTFNFPMN